MHNITLIINADDYGYNTHIDNCILQLIKNKKINSISTIINGQNIKQAINNINNLLEEDKTLYKTLSIGLHFNLTQGQPLSNKIKQCDLVEGSMFVGKGKIYDKFQGLGFNQSYNEEIQDQFKAQVKQFISLLGRRPSHIDGHNHVHIIPQIASIIADSMLQLGIYRTRIPKQNLQKIQMNINHRFLTYSKESLQIYSKKGIIFADCFVGLQSFGKLSTQLIYKQIQRYKKDRNVFRKQSNELQRQQYGYDQRDISIEMMCHPGLPDPKGVPWIASIDRKIEKQQLQSQQFDKLRSLLNFNKTYYNLSSSTIASKPKLMISYNLQTPTTAISQCNLNKHPLTILQYIKQKLTAIYTIYQWKAQQQIATSIQLQDMISYLNNLSIYILVIINGEVNIQYICHQLEKIKNDRRRGDNNIFKIFKIKNMMMVNQLIVQLSSQQEKERQFNDSIR